MHINGFSLIEILFCLFIFSITILACTKLQINALQVSHEAYLHSTAITLIQNKADKLRSLSKVDLQNELVIWNNQIEYRLPNAKGRIKSFSNGYLLQIEWHGRLQKQFVEMRINV